MSQFDHPGNFADPAADASPTAPWDRRTSGLAVTSFILSVVICCPCITVLGPVLGAIAAIQIKGDPARKGMGWAVAAIIIGIIVTGVWIPVGFAGFRLYQESVELVERGPNDALVAGFAGDLDGFRAEFHGAAAGATDAEAQAFIDTLQARYGGFVSSSLDDQAVSQGMQPQFGNPIVPFPYRLVFENATVDAEVEIAFSDPQQGGFVFKLYSITIVDADQGDVSYPANQP